MSLTPYFVPFLTHTCTCVHTHLHMAYTHKHILVLDSNSPYNDFKSENDSLQNIVDQLRRSLQSLDGEIELHKLQHKERDKQIKAERESVAFVC